MALLHVTARLKEYVLTLLQVHTFKSGHLVGISVELNYICIIKPWDITNFVILLKLLPLSQGIE